MRVNHLWSAGTTNQGASGVLVCRIMSSIGGHVFVPELALGNVVHGKFPALGRLLDAVEEALALLVPRDVEKEFQDQRAVAREMPLEGADVLEALLPDVLADELLRQLLTLQQFLCTRTVSTSS